MKALWISLAVALSFSAVACGGGGCKGTCKDLAACEDTPDDFDEDACVDACEKAEDDAKDQPCESEGKKLTDCMDICDPAAVADDCPDEYQDVLDCLAEEG